MRIAMIGTGYVGLVSGACFADFGHQVTCIDKDSGKIDSLNAGKMPIWEPGLEALVKANVEHGRLRFTTDLASGVEDAQAVFIAVGTPARAGDGHADLTYVHAAARELARVIAPETVVITKSTVPVGTGDSIDQILTEEGRTRISVASNPEFLREGAAIRDFKIPDWIVVGAEDERAREVLRQIYRPLFLNQAPILFTTRRTAELTKYAANAFLAVKISFINEIANLCEAVDADVQDVARGIGLDNRIGPKFLHAGPGYGGSCFPKDTLALLHTAEAVGVDQRIVRTVVEVNDERKQSMVDRIAAALGGDLAGKRVAVLGLAFKPNTDDMRDAPSIPIVTGLLARGAEVMAFDPVASEQAKPLMQGAEFADEAYVAAEGADALVIVTEWDELRALDLDKLAKAMRGTVLVDLRNVYDPATARLAGFSYLGVGRGESGRLSMANLLTGAAGFIGFHIARALLARGERVIGIDDLNPYYDPALKRARIDALAQDHGEQFVFHQVNFADDSTLQRALAGIDLGRIVHVGAQAGVRYAMENPGAYIQSNLVGHMNILELARSREVRHLVYASSSSVYGGSGSVPFKVDDRADRPLSLYAATKRADELLSESYSSLYRIPMTGLRFFTVYGPWGRPDMAIWLFTEAILAGEPVELFNHGKMRRDFTYVDDIVAGVVASVDSPPSDDGSEKPGGSRAPHALYNIGNNHAVDLMRLIEVLEDALGRKAVKELLPAQPGEEIETCADISDIRRDLGFEPRTTIEEGVPRFVDWYKSYHGIA